MPYFQIVANANEINLQGWSDLPKFQEKIVNEQGKEISGSYRGRRFQLFSKKIRVFTTHERISRVFRGILAVIFSCGLGLKYKSVINLFKKKYDSKRFGFEVGLDPLTFLPKEINKLIFSNFNKNNNVLFNCSLVNKKWCDFSKEFFLVKNAFGKAKWEQKLQSIPLRIPSQNEVLLEIYNKKISKINDVGIEPYLPKNIYKMLKNSCPIIKSFRLEQTHKLFLIPKTINGEPFTFELLSRILLARGITVRKDIIEQFKDNFVKETYWVLMSHYALFLNKDYDSAKKLLTNFSKSNKIDYDIPNLFEVGLYLLIDQSRTDDYHQITMCEENIGDKHVFVHLNRAVYSNLIDYSEDCFKNRTGIAPIVRLQIS